MGVREEYLRNVRVAMKENPNWRRGQAAFNVAAKMFPEVAEKYRGGELDPFYANEKLNNFVEAVVKDVMGEKDDK